MILKHLSLLNYKNFEQKSFDFGSKINCIVGDNGKGKTNVLDAIYHLSFCKSYFNPISAQNIRHQEDFFVINGTYNQDEKEDKIVVSFKHGQKKIVKRNNKAYDRLSDHIGLIPAVIISPADRDLITEGSETRRKFIDGVIVQSNKTYLEQLIHYQKIVAQRNALLKYFAKNNTYNPSSIEIYNDQMVQLGKTIHVTRNEFIKRFGPILTKHYAAISSGTESVELIYQSDLNDQDFETLLNNNLQKDRIAQFSTVGVHKDDLQFIIDGYPIKKFGSQGQQKSFLIALKLAQFDFIKSIKQITPLLLLDDIFDKLDEQRVGKIIQLVDDDFFGQIFISDTHHDRTEKAVKAVQQSYQFHYL